MATTWSLTEPDNPQPGDCRMDTITGKNYIWTGDLWSEITDIRLKPPPSIMAPTQEQLDKYPALKTAWEDFLIVRKLIGQ